jgi:hypothetical protein
MNNNTNLQKSQPEVIMKRKLSYISASVLLVTGIASASMAAPAYAKGNGQNTSDTSVVCNITDIKFGSLTATACEGAFSGNDTGAGKPLETLLDGGLFSDFVGTGVDWSLLGKSDDTNPEFITAANTANGTLTIANDFSWLGKTFVISLKASNSYSAYLFQNFQSANLQAIYNTIGVSQNGQGNAQGLSHASVFLANLPQTPPPTSVPEPASLVGLGLIVTGMLKIRHQR